MTHESGSRRADLSESEGEEEDGASAEGPGGLSCRLTGFEVQAEDLRRQLPQLERNLRALPRPRAQKEVVDWLNRLQPELLVQELDRVPSLFADHCRLLLELVALCPNTSVILQAATTLERLLALGAGALVFVGSILGHDQFAFRSPIRELQASPLPSVPRSRAWVPDTDTVRRYLRCYGADFSSAAALAAAASSAARSGEVPAAESFPMVNFVFLCRMVKLFADCYPDLYLERTGDRRGVLELLLRACVDPAVQEVRLPVMDAVHSLLQCSSGVVDLAVRLQGGGDEKGGAATQNGPDEEEKSLGSLLDSPPRRPPASRSAAGGGASPMRASPARKSSFGQSPGRGRPAPPVDPRQSSILNFLVPNSRLLQQQQQQQQQLASLLGSSSQLSGSQSSRQPPPAEALPRRPQLDPVELLVEDLRLFAGGAAAIPAGTAATPGGSSQRQQLAVTIRVLQSLPYSSASQEPLLEPVDTAQGLLSASRTLGVSDWTDGVRQWTAWLLLRRLVEGDGGDPKASPSSSQQQQQQQQQPSQSQSRGSDPADDLPALRRLLQDKIVLVDRGSGRPRELSNGAGAKQLRVRVPTLSRVRELLDQHAYVAERARQPMKHAAWLLSLVELLELVIGDIRLCADAAAERQAREHFLRLFPDINSRIPLRQQNPDADKLQSAVEHVSRKWSILGLSAQDLRSGVSVLSSWEDVRDAMQP